MRLHTLHSVGDRSRTRATTRTTIAAFTVVGLAASIAGCSAAEPAADGDGVLTIQSPWSESTPYFAPFNEIIEAFEATDPGFEVEVVVTSNDQNQEIFQTNVLAGNAPDIVITNPTRDALSWVEQGVTVPVDDYLTEWGLDQAIYPEAQDDLNWQTAEGELRGFPLVGFVWPTWYNGAALDEAGLGVPTDEASALDYAEAVGSDSSVIVGGSDWSGFNAFIQTLQAYIPYDRLNELCAEGGWSTDPAAQAGAEWFVTLRDAGFWSTGSSGQTVDGANASFQGAASTGINLISDFFGTVPAELVDTVRLGGIPVPEDGIEDKPIVMAGYSGGGIMISTEGAETNLDAVRQFVEFFYQPENVAKFVDQAGMVAAANFDESGEFSNKLLAQANSAEFRESVSFVGASNIPSDVVEVLTRAASVAWADGTSAAAILEAMDAVY